MLWAVGLRLKNILFILHQVTCCVSTKARTLPPIFFSLPVNSVSWAPHELGAILACASSDGKVSVLTFKSLCYKFNFPIKTITNFMDSQMMVNGMPTYSLHTLLAATPFHGHQPFSQDPS